MPPHLGPVVSGLFALGGVGAMLNGWLMDHFNGNVAGTMCMGYLVNNNIGWSQIFTILVMPAAVMTLCMLIKNISEAAHDASRFPLSQQDAE